VRVGAAVAMREYRAYTVALDGHIIGFEPMVCVNDEEAIERARRLVEGDGVELGAGRAS
jgi:hypothetical protein